MEPAVCRRLVAGATDPDLVRTSAVIASDVRMLDARSPALHMADVPDEIRRSDHSDKITTCSCMQVVADINHH